MKIKRVCFSGVQMLEKIDFSKDYGEIFAEAKKKAEYVFANPLSDDVLEMAHRGENDAFEQVYYYYMPVVEFFYLRDMPWIDSEYERNEMLQVYSDTFINAIRMYKKKTYYNLCNCIRILLDTRKKRGHNKIQKEEEWDKNVVSNDIDSVGIDKTVSNEIESLIKIIDFLPNDKDREIIEWVANGRPLSELARNMGCTRQALSDRCKKAQNRLKRLYATCQKIDYQRNVLNKPILQICMDIGIPRIELCYYLRVLDYMSGKTDVLPKHFESAQDFEKERGFLCLGSEVPKAFKSAENFERARVAECMFKSSEYRVYSNLLFHYGNNFKKVPKHICSTYEDMYSLVDIARRYMRAVVDSKDGGKRYWTQNGIDANKLQSCEFEFFVRLYNYVMFDGAKPCMSRRLKSKLDEKVLCSAGISWDID